MQRSAQNLNSLLRNGRSHKFRNDGTQEVLEHEQAPNREIHVTVQCALLRCSRILVSLFLLDKQSDHMDNRNRE